MPNNPIAPDLDRELTPRARDVVAAARAEFAAQGYAGATTDAIARRAGVSQPYVVRLFGSKERLFLRCAREVQQQVIATYRQTAEDNGSHPEQIQLGAAFRDLLISDPVCVKLMHQINALGQHPELGDYAREWFVEVYSVVRHECHLNPAQAADFLSKGTLISTLVYVYLYT
jgi:AcrR family transcriptional regulator